MGKNGNCDLHASSSLKFFAGSDTETLFLFREKTLLWRRKFSAATRLIDVADDGSMLVSNPEGFFILPPSGADTTVPLPALGPAVLSREQARLGKVMLEDGGGGLLAHKISRKKQAEIHQLIRYDVTRDRQETIWKFSSGQAGKFFHWDATRDLAFLAVSEEISKSFPRKGKLTQISLHEPRAGKSIYAIDLPNTSMEELKIGRLGTLAVCAAGLPELAVIHTDGRKALVSYPEPGARVLHVGRHFVLLGGESGRLHFKDLSDRVFLTMEREALHRPSADHSLFFQENDDAVIAELSLGEPEIHLVYTSLQNLEIEYRRIKNEAEKGKSMPLPPRETEREIARQKDAGEHAINKRKALSEALLVPDAPKAPPVPKARPARKPSRKNEIIHQLESLKLQKLTGAVDEKEAGKRREELEAELQKIENPGATKPPSPPAAGAAKSSSAKSRTERKKIEKLLEKLEERFIHAEISEKIYLELKRKYQEKLKET